MQDDIHPNRQELSPAEIAEALKKVQKDNPAIHRGPSLEGVLIDKKLTDIFTERLKRLEATDERAAKDLNAFMGAGVCKEYYTELGNQIVWDILKLDFSAPEDQIKMCARFNYAKGALEVLTFFMKLGEKHE